MQHISKRQLVERQTHHVQKINYQLEAIAETANSRYFYDGRCYKVYYDPIKRKDVFAYFEAVIQKHDKNPHYQYYVLDETSTKTVHKPIKVRPIEFVPVWFLVAISMISLLILLITLTS